jgi:hypothetical protein
MNISADAIHPLFKWEGPASALGAIFYQRQGEIAIRLGPIIGHRPRDEARESAPFLSARPRRHDDGPVVLDETVRGIRSAARRRSVEVIEAEGLKKITSIHVILFTAFSFSMPFTNSM